MNLSDIQDGESNIEGTAVTSIRYYKVDANGLPEGDGEDSPRRIVSDARKGRQLPVCLLSKTVVTSSILL